MTAFSKHWPSRGRGANLVQLSQLIQLRPDLARLHPAAIKFLMSRYDEPDMSAMTVEEARDRLSKIQAGYIAKLPVDIEKRTVLVGPRGNTAIRIVRPRG